MSRTVKVRIAVAVDPEGDWNAVAWSDKGVSASDGDMMDIACDTVLDGEARYWVEVELPVPDRTPVTLSGTVTRVDK